MKRMKSLFWVIAIIAASAAAGSAQVIFHAQPEDRQQTSRPDERDYSALVREVFAPITDELNLTTEQKFKIVAIITGAVIKADPLMDKLDELDDEISAAAVADSFDETRIRQLSSQEAQLMEQIIAMKARAKAGMYQILTPEQRAVVARQFRRGPTVEGSLGSIGKQ